MTDDDDEHEPQPVHAVQSTTGLGKTSIFVEEVANDRLHPRPDGAEEMYSLPWGLLVPTHRLGRNVAKLFRDQALTARVIRGRDAKDEDGVPMCHEPEAVKLAMDFHAPIQEACCEGTDERSRCRSFVGCRYQEQFPAKGEQPPDVFALAHQMMFHDQKKLGEFAALGVDESFWEAGLWGIGKDEENWTLDINEVTSRPIPVETKNSYHATARHKLETLRVALATVLQRQEEVGGFERRHLEPGGTHNHFPRNFIDADDCSEAIGLEWELMPKVEIVPGMSAAARKAFYIAHRQEMLDRQFAQRMIKLWMAVRDFLNMDAEVSGRIVIKEFDRKRQVAVRGVRAVCKQWQVPAMVMDATLPALPMLQAYFPQVEVGEPIEEDPPACVVVRQVLKAPVSKERLLKTESDVNRHLLRRYILRRWTETGRQPTLVICQMEYEYWLTGKNSKGDPLEGENLEEWRKLPDDIAVEHYNNVAGLDDYKEVRLLICIGRVVPGPEVAETYAGVLTGAEPKKLPYGTWYRKVRRGIRLPDGSGVAVDCDRHPDPMAEMVRYQLCEAELVQAIGRGRAINRTPDRPLDIDIVADVCLPITVNEVSMWWQQAPSPMVEAVADGVVLLSRVDMVKLWPHVWENDTAARRTLEKGAFETLVAGWEKVTYQLAGPKMKPRVGYFDPAVVQDPRSWLEARLGPVKVLIGG